MAGGTCMTGDMATAVGGAHPTGMHSCSIVLHLESVSNGPGSVTTGSAYNRIRKWNFCQCTGSNPFQSMSP